MKPTFAHIICACCLWLFGCTAGDSTSKQDAAPDDGGAPSDGSASDAGSADASSSDAGSDAATGDAGPNNDGPIMLHGAAEKGPLVLGSSLSVSAVTSVGMPTGLVFNTETTDDLGHFELSISYRGPAALEATGYYYNEVTGTLSHAQLTLRGWYEVGDQPEQAANVNVITHLANRRVLKLVKDGATFMQAQEQAESELVSQLGIAPPASIDGSTASILDSAYLFAVSAVCAEAGGTDAAVQELLNQLALDLEDDGALTTAHYDTLRAAQDSLDPKVAMDNLAARMKELGQPGSPPDLNTVLDSDLDGLVNDHDNCPNVANADQADFDDDGVGNVCCVVASVCTSGGTCATGPDNAGYSCGCVGGTVDSASAAAALAPCTSVDSLYITADLNLPLLETVSVSFYIAPPSASPITVNLPALHSTSAFNFAGGGTAEVSLPELTSTGAMTLTGAPSTSLSLPKLQTIHGDMTTGSTALDAPLLDTIDGALTITGSLESVTLPALSSVGKDLVAGEAQLKSLSLPALESVAGIVSLSGINTTSVDLSSLATVGINLRMVGLSHLTSIEFPALTMAGGLVQVAYTNAAVSFPVLQSAGNLTINNCTPASLSFPVLTSVENFELTTTGLTSIAIPSLTTVTQGFSLDSNSALTSASFVGLTSVGGNFSVNNNAVLTALDVPGLTTVGSQFRITDNKQLPTSQANALHDQLTTPPGSTVISGNKP